MTGPSFPVGLLLGVPLRVHVSWFVTVSLLTAVFAIGTFPRDLPAILPALHWVYGLIGALLLFASVLTHELSHALMAKRRGLPVAGITLHGLGGVALVEREPASPRDELWVTGVGPLTSYALALAGGIAWLVPGTPPGLTPLLSHFVVMNLTLGTFNLVPGFPLDGGRLLRAILWAWHGDYDRATRSASRAGAVFAIALVALGFFSVARTGAIAGLWLVAVGLYLRRAARTAEMRLTIRRALEPVPVRVVMAFETAAVPGCTTLDGLARGRPSTDGSMCAVLDDGGTVVGLVSAREVDRVPRERWPSTRASDIMVTLRDDLTTAPGASCWEAFCRLQGAAGGRLLVLDEGRPVGTLGLGNLTALLTWSRHRP
jgi:Zn-dependent protease